MNKSYFERLAEIDCSGLTENKGGLTYLSWAHAWREFKSVFPKSYYTVYESQEGWNYFTDGRYCWVKTGVTVVDEDTEIEHIEYLPIMDYKNKSIPAEKVDSFDVNKAIQRSLTKAVARHGLGLYIYAGEDLPDAADGTAEDRKTVARKKAKPATKESPRIQLRNFCNEHLLDLQTMSEEYRLSKETPDDRILEVLEDLKRRHDRQ